MPRLFSLMFVAVIAVWPTISMAGSSEAGKPQLPVADVATFANRVQHDLAARGANIAIVSRIGRDPRVMPKGVQYTHVGIWVYSQITRADGSTGRGYQVYNLYQVNGTPTRSRLVRDSPADFFAGAYRLEAGIIIPDLRLQKKLLKVITSPTYSALHNPQYSVLANPNTSQFQNCTEHTLDVLMASVYGTSDPAQIKANIGAHFKPQPIRLGGLKRMLAPGAYKAMTTVDHGSKVSTATFGSIARFMEANKLTSETYRITPDKVMRF
ncbi:DUF2145 domain-containing protein [Sulfitobacter sp. SK012]|uniref:DUF2145 domain-containing protein n=1 Tax=Sulfitobacter sp. SK012 TaxID=1389005 RepID=UPI000E0C8245|nr:DUF2145 domain-containing protein [Sulfitobacter sp. SK012]AXI47171.1 DUF2145 domain-containing protein [Sulfitobacter sp. SK012]